MSVLIADRQTAGRGRGDHAWLDAPGASLAMSVLLRPGDRGVGREVWSGLSLVAGVAVVRALDSLVVGLELKWPNDVLVEGRKVAGILCEASASAVVVGIGVNVAQQEEQLAAAGLVDRATSLLLKGSPTIDTDEIAARIVGSLETSYGRWADAAGDLSASGVLAEYRSRCSTIGSPIRLERIGAGTVEGVCTGVDESGRILVQTEGDEYAFDSGEVHHIRPTR